MSSLEGEWPDGDRRDVALGAVGWAVEHAGELWPTKVPGKVPVQLTPAQTRVMQAMSVGLSYPDAADVLGLSIGTVKDQLTDARRLLRAKNTTHAVAEALRRGLIQ